MIVDQKILSGIMDTDSSNEVMAPNHHKLAYNIRFRNGRPENIPGTVRINNGHLPSGTNHNNGGFYDAKRRRIIWFNWNANGNHGIYSYSTQTGVVSRIFQCGLQSATDILNFDRNYPIHSANIVYRDTEGDLLYWTDGTNRPKYLNIDTVATLAPFTAEMINAAKNAPLAPPSVGGFISNVSILTNYLINKQFRFAYRWIYKNGERSTVSPISALVMPQVVDPVAVGTQPTLYNQMYMFFYAPTSNDFKAIELLMQEGTGTNNIWTDFKVMDVLDRDQYGIALGSTITYNFFNNGNYPIADVKPDDLYFYYLPDKSNSLELLNGNAIIYAGNTDGYPSMSRSDVDVTITSSLTAGSNLATPVMPTFRYATPQRFGLQYFNDLGKPVGGVISFVGNPIDTTDFAVTTPEYGTTTSPSNAARYPKVNASINHLPPPGATSFQWVRANLTPIFRHYVTYDYQTDAQYIYLGIENFVQMAAQNSFISPYDFSPGDRVKIMARWDGDDAATAYSTQYDLQILEVVERSSTIGSSKGLFIKCWKPAVLPTPTYSVFMLIDIYTPILSVNEKDLVFFEWGQKYDIVGGYHMGYLQNQTASQPATFEWTDGDVFIKRRSFYVAIPIAANTTASYLFMQDANWNDYVATAGNSNGRGWQINAEAKTTYSPTELRWGQLYEQDGDQNKLNAFYPLNYDTIDRARGDILRLMVEERVLYVYQTTGVARMGIYSKFIQDNNNSNILTTTNEIITTNNVDYLQGNFGLGPQPCSLVRGKNGVHWFVDVTTGTQCRRSLDGITPISELYKGQYYIKSLLTPYNKPYVQDGTGGPKSRIIGGFDYLEEQYICSTEAGRYQGVPILPFTWSFNEQRKGYNSFYGKPDNNDFTPEWIVGAEEVVYMWKDGELYRQNNTNENEYCNLFGIEYPTSLKLVFNKNVNTKKNFHNLQYQSNQDWACPTVGDINTSVINPNSNIRQQSQLIPQDIEKTDNIWYAYLLRDMSAGGFLEDDPADYLNGNWIEVNFVYSGNKFAWLFLPTVVSEINQRNY